MPSPPELSLRDIHLPDTIGWWPPAIGWWLVVIGIPLCLFFCYWLFKRITRKTAIKSGIKQLEIIKNNSDLDDFAKLQQISILIRRIAISHFSRTETASLTGTQWLAFLDQHLPEKPFSEGVGRQLLSAPYQQHPSAELDIEALLQLCTSWLQSIKRGKS